MTERAYKFRFYPTLSQENLLRRTMGCVRLVYNKALAARTIAWYEKQTRIDYKQTSSLLTSWKKTEELDFLNEVSCVPLQQCLRHLQKAFSNFWGKRAKYPRFKKKRNGGSAEFTKSAFKYRDGKVWLAKCSEPLNIVWSRYLPQGCEPSTVTVKLEPSGRWFVSLLVDDYTVEVLPPTEQKIGLDVGVSSLLSTSDGDKIANPKHFNRLYQKLACAQKELSRKTKGSSNRERARLKVARIHAKIKDARTDFLHKLTTRLVRLYSLIAIEDLAVSNMVKNRKLARSLSDAAICQMFRQLEYKCEWYGRKLVKIDRFFPSSKRCHHCGFVMDKLPLNIRSWDCPSCKTTGIDRDINAGKNILAAGLAVIVCGADIRPDNHSVKGASAVLGVSPMSNSRRQLRKTAHSGRKQKPKS
ncbi:transposase, IS605 OrfB family [Stanieria cyanosphaera PCC 7437]|uniref:Transposase, IS605 OrfB family n=1 Tax=Stanieria cyanosphaera (strain ATCC 29371 / PCC 7437) TaxID=111780 RepID=K9XXH5_STAC7|nr:RNA-guided endonuclease TnpB family protein [Stanieria cyanosphaera]AFZ35034.1 transposase, IS605 OrfB family [Stanieria cyanosphaera PCC 7437]AFZ36367.1 transposase, IS605 OrfB family [Stanieria cyanosphaera PCC 7437]